MKVEFLQKPNEIIDVAEWKDWAVYPEGSRDKKEVFSPAEVKNKFIIPNYRYLFKYSRDCFPWQFWMEVFSYYFGELIGVAVPPVFVGKDREDKYAALIEWFYCDREMIEKSFRLSGQKILKYKSKSHYFIEQYVSGRNFMTARIENFDEKYGIQHNLETLFDIMEEEKVENWLSNWVEIFVFDALIGNTDRHQDNWGILYQEKSNKLSPAFDNGTSLGHEILEENFYKKNIDKYISKGYHHIKLSLDSEDHVKHLELLKVLSQKYSKEFKGIIEKSLSFEKTDIEKILNYLVQFNIDVPLTELRADFMLKLIMTRKEKIKMELLR